MKRKIFVILFFIFLLPSMVFCQEHNIALARTKIEEALQANSKVIVKESFYAGEFSAQKGATIECLAMSVYSMGKAKKKTRGLKISVVESAEKIAASFIDLDEVSTILTALDDILFLSDAWKSSQKQNSEAGITTNDNLRIGFFQQGSNQIFFIKAGQGKVAQCFLYSKEDLFTLKRIITKGLDALQKI